MKKENHMLLLDPTRDVQESRVWNAERNVLNGETDCVASLAALRQSSVGSNQVRKDSTADFNSGHGEKQRATMHTLVTQPPEIIGSLQLCWTHHGETTSCALHVQGLNVWFPYMWSEEMTEIWREGSWNMGLHLFIHSFKQTWSEYWCNLLLDSLTAPTT